MILVLVQCYWRYRIICCELDARNIETDAKWMNLSTNYDNAEIINTDRNMFLKETSYYKYNVASSVMRNNAVDQSHKLQLIEINGGK